MEGRRIRRFGRGRQSNQTLLPLRHTRLSNTVSCWYCDFKSSVLNEPLFRFGRRNSRWLRIWFSVGIGFSLTALLGVIMILLWELGRAMHLYYGNAWLGSLFNGSIFGISSMIPGASISLPDIGYVCLSSILSVFVHEVGHALAAASEGIQMEYIAVFVAVLFPGALIAFNHELLQALPPFASLRIYCAGIWHNAAFCVVCALALFLLPLLLNPLYIHGESPMVLDVNPMSPLSGYLSPYDLIISLDGTRIHTMEEWKKTVALLNEQITHNFETSGSFNDSVAISDRKGYCVPYYMIKGSMPALVKGSETTCPNEFNAFTTVPCLDSQMLDDSSKEDYYSQGKGRILCFNPKDVIKLEKCGDAWGEALSNRTRCPCLEDESCFTPVQMPGLAWVEIVYLSRTSPGCNWSGRKSFPEHKSTDSGDINCTQSFVFVGDLFSLGESLYLTSYQPRWSIAIGACLPNVLEKLLICAFHVSLTLALLNSLPVYFLDGECILKAILQYFGFIKSKDEGQNSSIVSLLGGTFISALVFLQIFLFIL